MELFVTGDGSHTVMSKQFDAMYHSRHGAIQETNTVFIEAGLKYLIDNGYKEVSILEIGFGTGLNAYMTYLESQKQNITINYVTLETYPLSIEDVSQLNYPLLLNSLSSDSIFIEMHTIPWEINTSIATNFYFQKRLLDFLSIEEFNQYDLIYFDAFSPEVQPELWDENMFKKMYGVLRKNGVMTTYCAKGIVKRNLKSVGFSLESLAGPPGKREMTRVTKK
jgi:tRNA U34 5-methylaminomethyl-2-thiouridine-forming methyltransferase MnmC